MDAPGSAWKPDADVIYRIAFVRRRGGTRLVGDLAEDSVEATNERQFVDIQPVIESSIVSGLVHEISHRVVRQQQGPDLLTDQFRRFQPQYPALRYLMGFDLVEGQLELHRCRYNAASSWPAGPFHCGQRTSCNAVTSDQACVTTAIRV